MLRTVAIAALLLHVPAHAGVYAYNDASDINNNVNITVTNEWVNGLLVKHHSAVVTIPPRQNQQYHTIRLCHGDANLVKPWLAEAVSFQVAVHPSSVPSNCKIVSAWGTLLASIGPPPTELFRAIQTDRVVQFHGDYEADDAVDPPGLFTNGTLILRGNHGCWPAGLASAVRFRLEARRGVGTGAGLAQISIFTGNGMVDGSKPMNEGNMGFRTQQKGYTRENQPDTSGDNIRLVIPPGQNEALYGIYTTTGPATVQCSGFELRP